MGDVTTGGSSTTPNSKLVSQTGDTLLKGLQKTYKGGVDVYGKPLYTDPSSSTKGAWNAGTSFGNSLIGSGGYGTGQREAQDSLGGVFSGYGSLGSQYAGLSDAYDPNSEAYQTLRGNISNDVLTDVASLGASNGRYGAKSFNEGAAEGLGNALAGLDYQNMSNDISNRYRSLDSQAGALGGQAATAGQQFGMGQTALGNQQNAVGLLGQIGASKDADALAKRMADADLYDKKKNSDWEALARASSILGGTAGASGSSTSNTIPWYMALLGGAATGASLLG